MKNHPRRCLAGPKLPKWASRGALASQKGGQGAPKWVQGGPKGTPDEAKRGPREAKRGPRVQLLSQFGLKIVKSVQK